MQEQAPGFFVAPFGIDGEPEGLDRWELAKLSAKWLAICEEHLELHGTSFNAPWRGHISHVQMKFTSASGVALVTFFVRGRPAASVALASGLSPTAEADVMRMFVDSLRRVAVVRAAAASQNPFQEAFTVRERPVMIVVPWPDAMISEQDRALVRELAIHTAGAFFARNQRPG
jgi:hypothetical protein